LQKAHGSVAAARAEDGSYGRISESAIQLCQPALVVTGQIPVSAEDPWVVLNAVSVGNDGKAGVE
jgi:hypothetical protein